eukprot:scaffold17750_cov80-Skeletonema_menzelii.AAC.1
MTDSSDPSSAVDNVSSELVSLFANSTADPLQLTSPSPASQPARNNEHQSPAETLGDEWDCVVLQQHHGSRSVVYKHMQMCTLKDDITIDGSPAFCTKLSGENRGKYMVCMICKDQLGKSLNKCLVKCSPSHGTSTGYHHLRVMHKQFMDELDDDDFLDVASDDKVRREQEERFAALVVSLPLKSVKKILRKLFRDNEEPCLRINEGVQQDSLASTTKLKSWTSIVCFVDKIDDALLESSVEKYQDNRPIQSSDTQEPPLLCCINNTAKWLYYRCPDSGDPRTKALCCTPECTNLRRCNVQTCSRCGKKNNGFNSENDSRPFKEQLARRVLRLSPPQLKDAVDICKKCDGLISKNSRGKICIDLDKIPAQVMDLLLSKMASFEEDSNEYLIKSLIGIKQEESVENGTDYKAVRMRSEEMKKVFWLDGWIKIYRLPDPDAPNAKQSKSHPSAKKSKSHPPAKAKQSKSHPPWPPNSCSMDNRIQYTYPPERQAFQTKMTGNGAMSNAAEAQLDCMDGIRNNELQKKVFDAVRKAAGLNNNDAVVAEDIENVFQNRVLKHKIMQIGCPPEKLLYQALKEDESGDCIGIIPAYKLPSGLMSKFAGFDYVIKIGDITDFETVYMPRLWGHMDPTLFRSNLGSQQFTVVLRRADETMYIGKNTITFDPESLLRGESTAELKKENETLKKKVEKKEMMAAENLSLKKRISELEKIPRNNEMRELRERNELLQKQVLELTRAMADATPSPSREIENEQVCDFSATGEVPCDGDSEAVYNESADTDCGPFAAPLGVGESRGGDSPPSKATGSGGGGGGGSVGQYVSLPRGGGGGGGRHAPFAAPRGGGGEGYNRNRSPPFAAPLGDGRRGSRVPFAAPHGGGGDGYNRNRSPHGAPRDEGRNGDGNRYYLPSFSAAGGGGNRYFRAPRGGPRDERRNGGGVGNFRTSRGRGRGGDNPAPRGVSRDGGWSHCPRDFGFIVRLRPNESFGFIRSHVNGRKDICFDQREIEVGQEGLREGTKVSFVLYKYESDKHGRREKAIEIRGED